FYSITEGYYYSMINNISEVIIDSYAPVVVCTRQGLTPRGIGFNLGCLVIWLVYDGNRRNELFTIAI
ncbi:MAG: hypothetical protein ACKPKO_45850, partial [Candidatus Fonsibacter sp.]